MKDTLRCAELIKTNTFHEQCCLSVLLEKETCYLNASRVIVLMAGIRVSKLQLDIPVHGLMQSYFDAFSLGMQHTEQITHVLRCVLIYAISLGKFLFINRCGGWRHCHVVCTVYRARTDGVGDILTL